MIRHRTLALATVAAIVACQGEAVPLDSPVFRDPPARRAVRAELLGCFALEVGELPAASALYVAADTIELTGMAILDTAAGARGAFVARTRVDSAGGMLETTWQADSASDSVRIHFSDGNNGGALVLAAPSGRPARLEGRAREWGHVGPTGWDRGPAAAQRIACPSDTTRAS